MTKMSFLKVKENPHRKMLTNMLPEFSLTIVNRMQKIHSLQMLCIQDPNIEETAYEISPVNIEIHPESSIEQSMTY